jgi:hypothetical protein
VCTGIDHDEEHEDLFDERFPRVYGDRPMALILFSPSLMVSPCVRG